MKKIILFLPVLLLLAACHKNEDVNVKPEPETPDPSEGVITTKDSLEIYFEQTDKGRLLTNSLIYKDGILVLDLTLEDALSLGIDQSMYEAMLSQIEKINKSGLEIKQ